LNGPSQGTKHAKRPPSPQGRLHRGTEGEGKESNESQWTLGKSEKGKVERRKNKRNLQSGGVGEDSMPENKRRKKKLPNDNPKEPIQGDSGLGQKKGDKYQLTKKRTLRKGVETKFHEGNW